MEKLIDITIAPVASLLDLLLADKSTKKNIIWATDNYEKLGHGFTDKEQIGRNLLLHYADIIKPRIQKSLETQVARTRKKAEVFTPAWLCNMMNNYCDGEWFGRKDVFNIQNEDHTWTVIEEPIEFPRRKTWKHYVDSRRLEITCGEAPYLVSRYDVATGEPIVNLKHRIGQLDRKLRVVNENASDYDEWLKWVIRAFEATYGYEYQGDNLLIARLNLLLTFVDYYKPRWGCNPDVKLLRQVTNKIVWNIWQMDGLNDTVPLGKPYEEFQQMSFVDMVPDMIEQEPEAVLCKIYNWRGDNSFPFKALKEKLVMSDKKLFDFVIGNPPYQNELAGDSNTATPTYNIFMDEVYKLADVVELITPARFLFNAGYTPKDWNNKMLNDEHLKVLSYVPDSMAVFQGVDIKGGVVITYRNRNKKFGAIRVFTRYLEVNLILHKVLGYGLFSSLKDIIVTSFAYHYTKKMYIENPQLEGRSSIGHSYDLQSNTFSIFSELYFDSIPDDDDYIRILGREGNSRCWKYIKRNFINDVSNLDFYKVFYAKATGRGEFGETLPEAIIGNPGDGATVTFLSIGAFKNIDEANNCVKYTKTKFARTLLGILKVTQDNTPTKWKYVPLQDFTASSDIDWSKSIHEIDLQLYRKYGLDEKEIDFIETHVKEMA